MVNNLQNAEAPGASFMSNDSPSASNDLATKIRDDPLFMIKKKENEKKKELLKNPVRMKQLQQLLKADLGKKGRKDKKDKKRKKEKKSRNSPDEDKKNKYWYVSCRVINSSNFASSSQVTSHFVEVQVKSQVISLSNKSMDLLRNGQNSYQDKNS